MSIFEGFLVLQNVPSFFYESQNISSFANDRFNGIQSIFSHVLQTRTFNKLRTHFGVFGLILLTRLDDDTCHVFEWDHPNLLHFYATRQMDIIPDSQYSPNHFSNASLMAWGNQSGIPTLHCVTLYMQLFSNLIKNACCFSSSLEFKEKKLRYTLSYNFI